MKAQFFLIMVLCSTCMDTIIAKNKVITDDVHRYMWAEYQRFGGNGKEAYLWYKDLLSSNPSPHAHKGYIHFLSQTGNATTIVQLYDKHKDHFKDDDVLQLIFVQALEAAGRQQEADELLIALANRFKKNAKVSIYAAQMYIRKKEFNNALSVVNNFLNSAPKTPNNYIFHFLKSQVYTQQNDTRNALKSIKKSLKLYPHFDKGWLMYAALKEQAGHLQEAIKGYSTFLQKSRRPDFKIQRYMMNLIFKQKMLEQQTSTLLTDKTCLEQALILFKDKHFEQALEKIDLCIADEPNNNEAKLLKVQVFTSMHDYKKAADTIETFILNDPDNDTWYQALHLLCRSGLAYKKAIRILTTIEKKYPHALNPHLYLADLLTRDQQFERALEQHNKALANTTDSIDTTLRIRLLYNMAIIQYQQKKFTDMVASIDEIIKLDEQFLPALNLHAYYLATKGKNNAKAKKLLARVLKKEPNNPHYLDTRAVILYNEKNYQQAYDLLQKIAKQEPNDATIMKHLAKVQFKLGNKLQARATLDHATKYASMQEKKECESLLKRWKL